ncbi:bifunctional phosphopantothenoylcysteine decarboxylase/phosphopantothenate--cysteine ligase CoaBC [Laribacter hongkongensis]|uniref:bifunctional phosphopantothenoylcysteine decarboxylase/phosphopantothenate--cysteine ligase CoaBC n=1 Tax=Laribacter hongkongensis TaxID=168471 RepID=UPI001EFE25AC|nr:bifunctional phosphopantothenoylcysteine decarboxylase/phosphopantothenate--cysteine ligase CoaBC [Laribacter hongkongensis]MCG8991296.1 bifunctional phosphopantothenoylcysteine decarboxylase/phosphopantothenate--cysteine ligase CoaBC [Laribacter hongkongensis]MCG8998121.1 bifunctional phosphopantothenoylcysteine decarboxylase/phosphopantothenate--cysteine ligase CoaBC [Laribacter hongkongensis]MCG8999961.1 bifunctional phosphopantothenoylcysteine decarboxylase/phosphopantothenate--cysteine l
MQRHFLVGVTGGVAAYKTCELVRLLVKAGHTVDVVMTEAATRFVGPTTFQALSGRPVFLSQWDERPSNAMAHIELTRRADAFLIAPATADMLAKLAHGLCDDLVSTLAAARTCPLIVAPAMNKQMWDNPPNQRNVTRLQADGVTVFGPGSGVQACGETGDGRMLEPEDLFDLLQGFFAGKLLAGRRVLLTAGPTFEAIDPVRGLTNISSGKMGYALARACRDAGAEVTLVSGPTALRTPYGMQCLNVRSARDMLAAVEAHVAMADVFISVAAVADYRPQVTSEHKLKKTEGGLPSIALTENPDILAMVAARSDAPFCVGFAAESRDVLGYADEKRRRKNVPLLVANLAQSAMGADDNEVVLLDDSGQHPLPRMGKPDVARAIVSHLVRLLRS